MPENQTLYVVELFIIPRDTVTIQPGAPSPSSAILYLACSERTSYAFPNPFSKLPSSQAHYTNPNHALTPTCPNAPISSAQPAYSSPRSLPLGIPHREWHRPKPKDYILAPPSSSSLIPSPTLYIYASPKPHR